jgi:hypothetical protein
VPWNILPIHLERILALAPQKPGLIWLDDHPTTVIVKSVFSRLVASSGVDPAGWMIYIANAPGTAVGAYNNMKSFLLLSLR